MQHQAAAANAAVPDVLALMREWVQEAYKEWKLTAAALATAESNYDARVAQWKVWLVLAQSYHVLRTSSLTLECQHFLKIDSGPSLFHFFLCIGLHLISPPPPRTPAFYCPC